MRRFLLTISLALLFAGCGRKGPLIPPEALLPAPISNLAATQRGESFQISWPIPTREEGGRPLKDLAGFRLFKREVLPPAEDCESCPNAYRLFKSIDMEYPRDVRRVANSFYLNDTDVTVGTTYQYKIISLRKDGTSSHDSNKARIKKVVPPSPPRLTARFSITDAVLRWEGVSANIRVTGFNIYRRRAGEPTPLLPLNDAPVTGSTYEDTHLERGVTYIYTLRTVAEVEGEKVESDPSSEVRGRLAEPE